MSSFIWIFSLNFCFGGLPLSRKVSTPFQKHALYQLLFFLCGVATGALVAFSARYLIGTPVAEVLAATGLITGQMLFPRRNWRQEDLRGSVVGVFLIFAPVALFPLAAIWFFCYRLTRQPETSTFLASLALIPLNLMTRQSDIHFVFALFIVWATAAAAYRNLENLAYTGAIPLTGTAPRLYYFSRPVRRLVQVTVLSGVVFGILIMAHFSRAFYNQVQPPGIFKGGSGEERVVALTFDDGPHPLYTEEILNILETKKVKATFFLVGAHVERYPVAAQRIVACGHEIGNHTYSHANLYRRSNEKIQQQIVWGNEAIAKVTGIEPDLFRPPRGLYDADTLETCEDLGMDLVLWTVSSRDWLEPSVGDIVKQVNRQVHPGAVLLFHDNGNFLTDDGGCRINTVRALPKVIDSLREKGYTFITVGEMIEREKAYLEGEEQRVKAMARGKAAALTHLYVFSGLNIQ